MISNKFISLTASVAALALLLAVIIPAFRVDALSSSSLTLSDSRPSATGVNYAFASSGFDTGTTIRCIQLDIGTAVDGTGDAGLTVAGATLVANTITGGSWTVGNVEGTDQLRATDATGAIPNTSGTIEWGGIINGATPDTTYFGLFQTFSNIDCSTGQVDSVVVTLMFKAGSLVSLTIDPTLTFTVNGVADALSVNGATTTVASSATAINFLNDVTAGVPGVSAHDITVGTNASLGYTVYIKHTGLLTNGASDTITNWTGTNLSPTGSFPTAAEAWGYTTQDSSLSAIGDGANRFGSNEWAGFSTTNEEVVYSATPQSSETTRVGHQVAVAASTEAGTYQTTIIYTAASVY